MKKKYLIGLFAALLLSASFFSVSVTNAQSDSEEVIQNVTVSDITYESATISWETSVETQGKVVYGSHETTVTDWGTSFSETLSYFGINRTIEYAISVKDRQGAEYEYSGSFERADTPTPTVSATTGWVLDKSVRIDYGSDGVDGNIKVTVEYGTESGNYTMFVGPQGQPGSHYAAGDVVLENLFSNTKYYYRVKVLVDYPDEVTGYSTEQSFITRSAPPTVTSISPTEGNIGTRVTISGEGFSDTEGMVTIGMTYTKYCGANTEVLSWSDSEIVVNILDSTSDGLFSDCTVSSVPIWVYAYPSRGTSAGVSTNYRAFEGPEFTFVEIDDSADSTTNTSGVDDTTVVEDEPDVIDGVENVFGCDYSESVSNPTTVKVSTLFSMSSDTYMYLLQVYNEYYDAWNRYPRCDELQFHLDRSTPIERLKSWLVSTESNVPSEEVQPSDADIQLKSFDGSLSRSDDGSELKFVKGDDIVLAGTAIPNSTVKITVASEDPMAYYTKSDAEGYWTYTIDDELDKGKHTIDVAILDSDGEEVESSETISFSIVSTAKAATTNTTNDDEEEDDDDDLGISTTVLIIIFAAVIIILILVKVLSGKKDSSKQQE